MNFTQELEWRGMIHAITPGAVELLAAKSRTGYAGFDPTASSLHIGHLIPLMMLVHFQRCGHKPIALVGGATGMIGDPSGKSVERNLLPIETIRYNQECLEKQLSRFLDFSGSFAAEMVNNYDWFKEVGFLRFPARRRQAPDGQLHGGQGLGQGAVGERHLLYRIQLPVAAGIRLPVAIRHKNCRIQMGGSDQWGNITSGTELIRRTAGGEAHALTCPLLTAVGRQKVRQVGGRGERLARPR